MLGRMGEAKQPVIRKKLCQKVAADEVLRVIPVLAVTGQAPLVMLQEAAAGMVPVVALAAVGKVNNLISP
jgi:hypothetical protein